MIKHWSASTILIHMAIWALVAHFLFNFEGLYYSFYDLVTDNTAKIDDAIFFPLLIGLFYFNGYYLVPRWLNKIFWPKYVLFLLLSFAFVIGLIYVLYLLLTTIEYKFYVDEIELLDVIIFTGVLILAASTSLGVAKLTVLKDKQKLVAEQNQKAAELKFLNAQVNPHFLFNSLNSIYSLAEEEQAQQTMDSILKLSEIMRYPLNEGTKEFVPLTNEVEFITNFIELQQIRLGADYPIDFKTAGNLDAFRVAPLLLIPFVENAFKYGVSHRQSSPISIAVNCKDETITFNCRNKIIKVEEVASHELGINNVRSRLDLIYKDNYTLTVNSNNDYYIELIITDKQSV